MASFYKDKSHGNKWCCQYVVKATKKPAVKRGFDKKSDAVEWYKKYGRPLEDGDIRPAEETTVGEWLDKWEKTYCCHNQPNTRRGNQIYIEKHIKPAIGKVKLSELRPDDLQKMVNDLSQKYEPSTIHQIYRVAKAAMARAVKNDHIAKTPCVDINLPVVLDPNPNYCKPETVKLLIASLEGTRFHMPIYLCTMLGLRRGEALGLKWADIDGDIAHIRMQVAKEKKATVYKRLKTKRSIRDVDIPADLQAALKRHKKEQAQQKLMAGQAYQDQGFVCSDEEGGVLSPDCVTVAAKTALEKVGAPPGTHLHDLRHTFGTLLYQAGYPINIIADMMGDTVQTVMKYYVGKENEKKKDAAQKINELYKVQ
jgi:integrase